MPMEAMNLFTGIATLGTSTITRAQDPYSFNAPQWTEPQADPIAEAIKAAGAAASQISESVIDAARAVCNLLPELPNPMVAVEDNEITLEWYKDKHHVAVLAVDGQFVSWAVMAGPRNPAKGRVPFDRKLPLEAYAAIDAAVG